jgi:hypothetical protein
MNEGEDLMESRVIFHAVWYVVLEPSFIKYVSKGRK